MVNTRWPFKYRRRAMHIVLDRQTRKVIFLGHTPSASPRSAKEVYPAYDERSMEIGWTDRLNLPAYFTVDDAGRIRELSLREALKAGQFELGPEHKLEGGGIVPKTRAELVRDGVVNLDEMKKGAIDYYSALAFARRSELIPEYKLQNASLGVYEDSVAADYRETVKAFRNEFH